MGLCLYTLQMINSFCLACNKIVTNQLARQKITGHQINEQKGTVRAFQTNISKYLEWWSVFKKYLWLAFIHLDLRGQVIGQVSTWAQSEWSYFLSQIFCLMYSVSSHVSSRAQVIPSESHLVLALSYKLLELVSRLELKMGPQLADLCFQLTSFGLADVLSWTVWLTGHIIPLSSCLLHLDALLL